MAGQSFIVYAELERQIDRLTDEQVGQLFRAMFLYNRQVEPTFSDPVVGLAFDFVRPVMDKNREKWEQTKLKRAEAGRKSGEARRLKASLEQEGTSVHFVEQEEAKQTVNENVNANVNANASVNKKIGDAAISFFRENVSNRLSKASESEIRLECQNGGEETVIAAMQIASDNGKKSWGYCKGVLSNWKEQGRSTPPKTKKRPVAPEPWSGTSEGPDDEEVKAAIAWNASAENRWKNSFQWVCSSGGPCVRCRPMCDLRTKRTPEQIERDNYLLVELETAEMEGDKAKIEKLASQLSYNKR